MDYIEKDLSSYKLHLINTKKFKTITIRVVFHTPIIKEEITKRVLLSNILFYSSKNYPKHRDLVIKAEDLYGADISINNQRVGATLFTNFSLQVLDDKYSEEKNLEKSLEFFSEIIFNPDINNKSFKKEKLNIIKKLLEERLKSIKENSSLYSYIRTMENFDINNKASYRMMGYLEDLENIDTVNLYDLYQKMIQNDYVDIFVVGNLETIEITNLIKKYFYFPKLKKKKKEDKIIFKKTPSKPKIYKEEINNTQSKLNIVCTLEKLDKKTKNYSLVLANLILGVMPDSKLFKNVREENSLCYSINSIYQKLDNLIIIKAGIDKDNFIKTKDLIIENIKLLKKGNIEEDELSKAKEFYLNSIDEDLENENLVIDEYVGEKILGLDEVKKRKEEIEKISKKDIIKACKKIKVDTIFLLEGVENG